MVRNVALLCTLLFTLLFTLAMIAGGCVSGKAITGAGVPRSTVSFPPDVETPPASVSISLPTNAPQNPTVGTGAAVAINTTIPATVVVLLLGVMALAMAGVLVAFVALGRIVLVGMRSSHERELARIARNGKT